VPSKHIIKLTPSTIIPSYIAFIAPPLMSRSPTSRPGRRGREGSLFNDIKLKKEEDIYRRFGLYKYSSFATPHCLLVYTLVHATT